MGGFVSKGKAKIVMLGLDSSGKTTALYMMQVGEVVPTITTLGFNIETIQHNGYAITVRDIGGSEKVRPVWKYYVEGNDAIIFFIDASDRNRFAEAKKELENVLRQRELGRALLLVFANKQDKKNVMTVAEVATNLGLPSLVDRQWRVVGSSVIQNVGLREGLDWITDRIAISNKQKPLPERLLQFCSNNPILAGLITTGLLALVLRRKLHWY